MAGHKQASRAGKLPVVTIAVMIVGTTVGARGEDAASPANPLTSSRLEDLAGAHQRPLFAPDRKPPDPPAQAEDNQPTADTDDQAPPDVALIGVLQTGGSLVAVIRDGDSGPARTVRDGDQIGDWQISDVSPVSIVLRKGDRTVELRLFQAGDKSSPNLDKPAGRDDSGNGAQDAADD